MTPLWGPEISVPEAYQRVTYFRGGVLLNSASPMPKKQPGWGGVVPGNENRAVVHPVGWAQADKGKERERDGASSTSRAARPTVKMVLRMVCVVCGAQAPTVPMAANGKNSPLVGFCQWLPIFFLPWP